MNTPPRTTADATSQTDRVILTLREMLLRGDFRPGERLAELTLVPRLQASRTPVRLALDRLAHEGLLEPMPGGGFRIREFAIADIWDAIEVRGVLDGNGRPAGRRAARRSGSAGRAAPVRREMERLYPADARASSAASSRWTNCFRASCGGWRTAQMLDADDRRHHRTDVCRGRRLHVADSDHDIARTDVIVSNITASVVEAIEHRQGTRAESLAREYSRLARRNLVRAVQDKDLFRRLPGASLIRVPVSGHVAR